MHMLNGNFLQWMGRLCYLVGTMATNELAMRGATTSGTTELAHFNKKKYFLFFPLSRWMQVRFGNNLHWAWYYTFTFFMAESDTQHLTSYKMISVLSSLNHMRHLIEYTVNN